MRLRIALVLIAPTLLACVTRDDDYQLLRRVDATEVRRPTDKPTRFVPAARNDSEAFYVRQLLANGFGAEMLRTYAMTKRFTARTTGAAITPTTIVLGHADTPALEPERRRQVEIGWWKTTLAKDQPLIWINDDPRDRTRHTMGNLVVGLGDGILETIAPETGSDGDARSNALRAGYVTFLLVVAAEWRTPSIIDDRDELRALPEFEAVRANEGVLRAHGDADAMLSNRRAVATVLYRMAISSLGQKMADPAVYLPFLDQRPPRDVHPALLLGAFRNFQAKLLAAWSRARAAGRPPRDLIDLIEAYSDAYPAERAEATRIFLVTTYGATAAAAGVNADAPWDQVESRLAMLTA
ncbi:MAG TPA: hypothetical protein VN903_07380, partial [Polyangia bacterium]|nr:hypothetical protein [Polyangia bacterium]